MTIRAAGLGDAEDMGVVHTQAWAESYAGLLTPAALASRTVASRAARWRASIEAGTDVFVAADAGGMVGIASAVPRPADHNLPQDGFVAALYVLRRAQRQGFGRGLMSAMASALHARGCRQVALWVFDDNTQAIRFYTALGGQPVAHASVTIADWTGGETAYAWDDVTTLFPS